MIYVSSCALACMLCGCLKLYQIFGLVAFWAICGWFEFGDFQCNQFEIDLIDWMADIVSSLWNWKFLK